MARSAADVLRDPRFPDDWPFVPDHFAKDDPAPDARFYSQPRFVYHIDSDAVAALTRFYATLPAPAAALDICSSHVSHYPESWAAGCARVAALGMNAAELARNGAATETAVADLNAAPALPYADAAFDVATCCVSVDYLTRPREVAADVARVLRPGGRAVFSFSNRCFPTKAWRLWLQTGDLDHVWMVGALFHYARAPDGAPLFAPPVAHDISPNRGVTDPMYVVEAVRL